MLIVMKLLLVIIFAATLVHAAGVQITQDELVRRTQELYDAVVPGNQAPWKKYFADDCTFSDEKGRTMDKAKLVADITPLPAGYSGAIKIANVQSRILGDTAVLSYDLNETETIFGQNLTARYHTTDTCCAATANGRLSQARRTVIMKTRRSAKPTKRNFPITLGNTRSRPAKSERSPLKTGNYLSNAKAKKEELFPEASDIFFRKNVEGRILFHYNEKGTVDSLIDRRNNEDVVWRKASDL